jgi:hypothetical protein
MTTDIVASNRRVLLHRHARSAALGMAVGSVDWDRIAELWAWPQVPQRMTVATSGMQGCVGDFHEGRLHLGEGNVVAAAKWPAAMVLG